MRFLTTFVPVALLGLHACAAPLPKNAEGVPYGPEINKAKIPRESAGSVGAEGSPYGSNPESLLGWSDQYDYPGPSSTDVEYTPVQNQGANPTLGLILDFTNVENPQPIRGNNGATEPGPRTSAYDRLNSDLLARPGTDTGDLPNAKWPMGLSSNRAGTGENSGWARQQNTDELPVAKAMAGVDMRLAPNAYRELHWHSANEWSYIMNGSARVSAVNEEGETYVDDLVAGDLWYFPAGVPHSIQASPEGVEFLLVFNQGDFSEDDTDLVSQLFALNPREVLAKNFQTDVSDFENIPQKQKYIFKGSPMPTNLTEVRQNITGPSGSLPTNQSYSYHFSKQQPYEVPGGSVKVVDPTTFPIASNFSVALFTIQPGAMREIHWHLDSDEWNFFLQGQARVTVFAGPSNARTFDFSAGDVGYIPVVDSHYVENTGTEDVIYMEILQATKYSDVSAASWLGLTPAQVVKETLNVPQSFIDKLPKTKQWIVPGNVNYSTTNFTVASYPNAALNAQKRDVSATKSKRPRAL